MVKFLELFCFFWNTSSCRRKIRMFFSIFRNYLCAVKKCSENQLVTDANKRLCDSKSPNNLFCYNLALLLYEYISLLISQFSTLVKLNYSFPKKINTCSVMVNVLHLFS